MASSSCHVDVTEMKYKHHAFISFRGADVRRGLLSHLIKEFRRKGIDPYVDNKLERGGEISASLLTAIERSQILLVIFSKDYASSKWCLDELVKMMDCKKTNEQIVVPVFYEVEPSDVRHQKGDYKDAFAEHEKEEDMVKVQNWRSALAEAAQLSGLRYPLKSEKTESDLVDEIVEDVSKKLDKLCSSKSGDPSESNGLIGIDQNIAWIKPLLSTEPSKVLKLGIWGMGGIGKTTIARKVFDMFSPKYDGCCFLENIRHDLKNQLRDLQEKLVSELLEEENPRISSRSRANATERRLRRMKVLIVLDDVDSPNLLKDFLEPFCFGPGSRVIVTSRNKQVFIAGGFHEIHKVKELNVEESLKLFCINAFNESQPKMGYEEQSKKAVAVVKGIPLALKVFGSHLHSKKKDLWECALEKLKKYPDQHIQRVLRLSYDDGLDDLEKKIFLDIAFFFKKEDKGYVIRQLDAWDFYGASGIEALQDKALITISNDNRIQMHDLIQEMGWEIVRQESNDPRRRSRLRDPEEVYDVLKNYKGTDSVEGMLLDVSQIREVAFNVDSLKRMPNLRLLKFYSPILGEVPMKIRYFVPEDFVNMNLKRIQVDDVTEEKDWEMESKEYGRWSQSSWDNEDIDDMFKTNKGAHVVDDMEMLDTIIKMHILRLMNLNLPMHVKQPLLRLSIMQDFVNMKGSVLDISDQLVTVQKKPELRGIHKLLDYNESDGVLILATNNLSGSNQLVPLPNLNIGSVMRELMSLDSEIHIKITHHLFMEGCSVSKDFSLSTKEIRSLSSAVTGMETLNSFIELLNDLECSDARALPCENVGPKDSSASSNETRQLNLTNTRMELLNSSTGSDCSDVDDLQVETLRKELPFLRSTYYYRLSNLKEQDSGKPKLLVLFDGLRYSEQMSVLLLRELSFPLDGTCKWSYLWSISNSQRLIFFVGPRLTNCTVLSLYGSNVERLPRCIGYLLQLKELSLWGCRSLRSIPELPPSIQILDADGCVLLERLPSYTKHLLLLERMSLWGCRSLRSMPELPPSIQILDVHNCELVDKLLSYLECVWMVF